jgi:hypothetical protein
MNASENPFLQPEDFMSGYRDSIEELKNNPHLISLEKLCYELFVMNEAGKKFMEIITERYLLTPLITREAANYQLLVIWADGFRDAFRMIRQCAESHEQRIKSEMSKL